MPLNTLPSGLSTIFSGGLVSTAKRMISEIANMPIIIGIMPMPPSISMLPNVKRGKPAGLPRPTQATSRPSSSDTKPFSGRSDVMNTAQVSPSSTSQKYSNELNFSANSASVGAATISTAVPNSPPIAEKTRPAPSASLGLALLASSRTLRRYTPPTPACRACASGSPGMSPEKIAIAVAVTIAAIAGMGAMKNVTGTSSAVAIVAVSPGTAPTNRPNSDAASITPDVVRIEYQRERLRPGRSSSRRSRDSARAITTRCPAAGPTAAAPSAACRTRSGCTSVTTMRQRHDPSRAARRTPRTARAR